MLGLGLDFGLPSWTVGQLTAKESRNNQLLAELSGAWSILLCAFVFIGR